MRYGRRKLSAIFVVNGGRATRILVVEDNKLDMRLVKDFLEGSGYETLQATDGLEAIDLTFASLSDLILMDIQLPEISALEVTRRFQRRRSLSANSDRCSNGICH